MSSSILFDLNTNDNFKKIINNDCDDDDNIIGGLKVKNYTYNGEKYKIINYDKHILTDDTIKTDGLFRSVVLDENNKIVSFSPIKCISVSQFYNSIITPNTILCEDYVEGSMCNLFYLEKTNCWELSTKTTVGGETSFFKNDDFTDKKTFREMFFDAMNFYNMDINNLNKKMCYSYVLQHPLNKFVFNIENPKLFLVEIYRINENNTIEVISKHQIDNKLLLENNSSIFLDYIKSDKYLPDIFETMNLILSMGMVIKNTTTGERCKIRNPQYEIMKSLKCNAPTLKLNYLHLRKNGKISEYLDYFPENIEQFTSYRNRVNNYIHNLFTSYWSHYIFKQNNSLLFYPYLYRIHMYKLHLLYKTLLKKENKRITYNFVIQYIDNLSVEEQMILF